MVKKRRWEFYNYSKTKFCIENYLCATCSLKAHEPLCAPLLLHFAQKYHFEWLKFNCVNLSLQTGQVFCNPTDRLISGMRPLKQRRTLWVTSIDARDVVFNKFNKLPTLCVGAAE